MPDYNGYMYPQKDKNIKIFKIKKKRYPDQEQIELRIKQYIHPESSKIRAYIRQIVATESFNNDGHQPNRSYLVAINYRKGIDEDCYIEYADKVLSVTGVDGYELNNLELKLTAKETNDDLAFDYEEYQEWHK